MNDSAHVVVFLSGAGGGAPDLNVFRAAFDDMTRIEVIGYPGWDRYISDRFSADDLIGYLVEQIATRVPQGPIRIVGLSIGGHFGYAAALRLQQMGREIGGFCAIDSFMISSAKPSKGWKGRALREGWELLRKRRFGEFLLFVRSKFWRALSRATGSRLPHFVQKFSRTSPTLSSIDPVLEHELTMRLLIEAAAPWIAALDRAPIELKAQTLLLRTSSTVCDDAAWRRRCPNIKIFEISGQHHTLFDAENVCSLHAAFVEGTQTWTR